MHNFDETWMTAVVVQKIKSGRKTANINTKQELSYRQQIARKLRTQYAEASLGLNITP